MSSGNKRAVGELATVLPRRDKPWYRTPSLLQLNFYIFIVCFSASGMGFDGSMMNGLQSLSTWTSYFNNPNSALLGVTNAVLNLGPILFGGIVAWFADRFGRRLTLQVGCGLIVISAAIQAASQNLAMFIIARFLIGVGIEFTMVPSPVLTNELAYPTHRGKFTSLCYSFYLVGSILSSWTTYGTFRMNNSSWTWRIPSLLQGAIPCIQFFVLFWVPESPRWLMSKGRLDEARAFFVKYHGDGDEHSPLVEQEIQDIQDYIRIQQGLGSLSWKQCGNGVVSYYLSLILNSVGITGSRDKTLINGILQIVSWVAAIIGSLLVDRVGRRLLWILSITGMLASYTTWTVCSAPYAEHDSARLAKAVLVLIFFFQVFYSVGITPLGPCYSVEILPFHSRQKVMVVSYVGNSCAGLFNSFVSPIALDGIGWKYYLVYIVMLLQFLIIVYLFFPETRGYALESISGLFEDSRLFLGRIKIRPDHDMIKQAAEKSQIDKSEVEFVENVATKTRCVAEEL
ncbi:hypothetical protein N7462_006631 [Penicillium macrosclerotiorum]|uniref:uncharacterized protein n=1 Tax=Penicillium macrosclerotiorum TaxID=303699 RepID=UPI00254844FC|nr:uncharacterized protein N7462_006631 [Penicillium macrosclerotiorum]KAJ5683466.1 hypothetical protein N7462_006631 [Penicillium macrosclerotiorum]